MPASWSYTQCDSSLLQELSSILERLPHPAVQREVTEDAEFAELRQQKEEERRRREQEKQTKLKQQQQEGEDEEVGEEDEEAEEAEEEEGEEGEEQQQGDEEEQKPKKKKKHLMQTFVFSATLTLPLFLKKRLRRGGGGAGGGAATLESLMDRVPFRTTPPVRVVDLTTQVRGVGAHMCGCGHCINNNSRCPFYAVDAHEHCMHMLVSCFRTMA